MNRPSYIWEAVRNRRLLTAGGVLLAAAVASVVAVKARAAGIPSPNAMIYTGYLETPEGEPMTEEVNVALNLWDDMDEGEAACEVAAVTVTPQGGRFQIQLSEACTEAVSANPNLWLEPIVNGKSLGRSKLGAVPYSVEANHAAAADAATPTGALATQLAAMQTDIDALKARLDAPLATNLTKFVSPKVIVSTFEWTWISGTDPAKLSPGRYWVFNTARTYRTAASGCVSNCDPASLVFLSTCMKVGDTLTVGGATLVSEPLGGSSLPTSAIDYFDFAEEAADVQLGLCAKRIDDPTKYDTAVADVYTAVMSQPK